MLLARVHAPAGRTESVEDGNSPGLFEEVRKRDASPVLLAEELPSGFGSQAHGEVGLCSRQPRGIDRRNRGVAGEDELDLVPGCDRARQRGEIARQKRLFCRTEKTRLPFDQGAIRNDIQLVSGAEQRAATATSSRFGRHAVAKRFDEAAFAADEARDVDRRPAVRSGERGRELNPLRGRDDRRAALPVGEAGVCCPALRPELPVKHPSPAGDQGLSGGRKLARFEHPECPRGGARRRDGAPRDRASDLLIGNQHQMQGREASATSRDEVERTQEGDDAALHVDGPGRHQATTLEPGRRSREHGVEMPDQEDGEKLRRGRRRAAWRAHRGRCRAEGIDDRQGPALLVGLEPDRDLEAADTELDGEDRRHPMERRRVVAGGARGRESDEQRYSLLEELLRQTSGDPLPGLLRRGHGSSVSLHEGLPGIEGPFRGLALSRSGPADTLTRRPDSAAIGRAMTRLRMDMASKDARPGSRFVRAGRSLARRLAGGAGMWTVATLAITAATSAAMASAAAATVAGEPAVPTAREVEKAVAAVYPALVNISAVSRDFAEGRAIRFPSAGSGVLVSEAGHVLTNFHVAGNSTRIRCTLTDGRIFDADVVAHDPLTDLSVLQLRAAGRGGPAASGGSGTSLSGLRPARLAVDAAVAIGDPVLALGNPFALSSSVTLGIVSNAHRVFTDFTGSELSDVELEGGESTGWLTQWIQHDALILPGNSGGPLVNLAGEVIGINELGGGGIGFAIPARVAADVLRHALADGNVRRSFLGFAALPVAKLGRETGALVSSVTAGGPAEAAGLAAGDILLALGGEAVEARFFEQVPELYRRVASLPIGAPVTLRIERRGKVLDLLATTQEMERLRGERGEVRALGISAEELTGPLALARNLRVREGVIVTGLRPGQAAATARPQVQVGDVLLAVNGQPVATIAALAQRLAAAAPAGANGGSGPSGASDSSASLVLKLLRSDQEILTLVRLPESRNGRWGGELPRAWLGVLTQVLSPELATALGRPGTRGYRVSEVYSWTNAEQAGLAVGDLLIALDGEAFSASRPQDADDLRRAVEARRIGDTLRLTVVRDGREREIAVELESRPAASEETRRSKQEEFEFSVRELTLLDRSDKHWPRDQAGVLVTDVTSGGWAHMAGLRIDDLILSLNSAEVAGVADFERRVAELKAARAPSVEVFVRRGAGTHFVFIEPEWPEGKHK